jgi:hypothetical protein
VFLRCDASSKREFDFRTWNCCILTKRLTPLLWAQIQECYHHQLPIVWRLWRGTAAMFARFTLRRRFWPPAASIRPCDCGANALSRSLQIASSLCEVYFCQTLGHWSPVLFYCTQCRMTAKRESALVWELIWAERAAPLRAIGAFHARLRCKRRRLALHSTQAKQRGKCRLPTAPWHRAHAGARCS